MIVPMKKVSLIILGDKKSETLKKLRKLGILHIEITEGSGEKITKLKEEISLLENAVFTVEDKKNKTQNNISLKESLELAKEIADLTEEKKVVTAEVITLNSELERLKSWGSIDPQKLYDLAQNGIEVIPFLMPKSEYDNLGDSVKTLCIEKLKSSVKFLIIKYTNFLSYGCIAHPLLNLLI